MFVYLHFNDRASTRDVKAAFIYRFAYVTQRFLAVSCGEKKKGREKIRGKPGNEIIPRRIYSSL